MKKIRVGLNLEQLLLRPSGGIGRYSAELARLLPVSGSAAGDDGVEVVGFVSRHRAASVVKSYAAFGLVGDSAPETVRISLPRPVLFDCWGVLGRPKLSTLSRRLAAVDIVHAPSLAVPPHPKSAPLVVTVHDAAPLIHPDTYPRRGRWFHERGFAATARRADLVIAPTQAAAEEIMEFTDISADRIRIVPHGVTDRPVVPGLLKQVRTDLELGEEPFVLWVGTLEPRKNLPVLVEAFHSVLAARDLPHRLVLAGPKGWLSTASSLEHPAAGLEGRVCVAGELTDEQLVALYSGADLMVLPSRHEGFGLPVLEAMTQGTAVLCSDIPVLREVGGEAAAYAPVDDAASLGEAMVELLRDDFERERLGEAGKKRAEKFSWRQCVSLTRAVYREALGS